MTLIDAIPKLPELKAEHAAAWAAAALAEAAALRGHDAQLHADADDVHARETVEELYRAWTQWADGAEALLRRVQPVLQGGRHVEGVYDLRYAVARARAMLAHSPETLRKRREQVRQGTVKTLEEVRSELPASAGRRREGGSGGPGVGAARARPGRNRATGRARR